MVVQNGGTTDWRNPFCTFGCVIWCVFLAFLFDRIFDDYISDYLKNNIYVTQADEAAGFADYCARGEYTPALCDLWSDGGTDMTTGTVIQVHMWQREKWHRIPSEFFYETYQKKMHQSRGKNLVS